MQGKGPDRMRPSKSCMHVHTESGNSEIQKGYRVHVNGSRYMTTFDNGKALTRPDCSGCLPTLGCGKSVLARHLIGAILPTRKSRTTCYFFFKTIPRISKRLQEPYAVPCTSSFYKDVSYSPCLSLSNSRSNQQSPRLSASSGIFSCAQHKTRTRARLSAFWTHLTNAKRAAGPSTSKQYANYTLSKANPELSSSLRVSPTLKSVK
ncbi:uncharacterized protein BDV17DRAFT_157306 [Aspergillus undulatus]|uniref:uncharacterized protein n=1 Tax=Aspergillus undulatus TaxID=1810928 RepID=UPI003CCE4C30